MAKHIKYIILPLLSIAPLISSCQDNKIQFSYSHSYCSEINDEKLIYNIEKCYYFTYQLDKTDIKLEDVYILNYYGVFNTNVHVVMMTAEGLLYTQALWSEVICGITITYYNGNRILAYYNDKMYTLQDAYFDNLLFEDDIALIASIQNRY